MNYLAWLIPLAPLVACLLCTALGLMGKGKSTANLVAWAGLGVASAVSLLLLFTATVAPSALILPGYQWIDIGHINVRVDLRLDTISLVQICVVTCVSFLVSIYAAGYMHGDPGYPRFFAAFSGFVFAMSMLVLANNLLILYAFWEGVGLCSYLLIGYWYQRPAAAKAAYKAFVVNRIADCGFLIGILTLGYGVSLTRPELSVVELLNFDVIFQAVPQLAAQQPALLTLVGFMLLIGAIGKSAQFPFHVWLPDAMEGPTPVSALIHAATMVTAGVFLLARMSPLLTETPEVLITAGWLGAITAIMAATIALYQHDLKKVLAYSTVSQLGYMFLAIGGGAERGVIMFAVTAAMFHLVTHAFFKALLFLVAGNVMHAMGDVIDMREFGGLKKALPKSHLLFLIGGAALAGIPPLAGFWSKDGILALLESHLESPEYGFTFKIWLAIGLLTAFLTSLYTFKAFFRTFYCEERFPAAAGHHPHDATSMMFLPLWILAIGSVIAGMAFGPTEMLFKYISSNSFLPTPEAHAAHGYGLLILSSLIAVAGALIAWWTFKPARKKSKADVTPRGFAGFAYNKFYIDELYAAVFAESLVLLSQFISLFDRKVVDGVWRGVTGGLASTGKVIQLRQDGRLQGYAIGMVAGAIVLLVIVWGT